MLDSGYVVFNCEPKKSRISTRVCAILPPISHPSHSNAKQSGVQTCSSQLPAGRRICVLLLVITTDKLQTSVQSHTTPARTSHTAEDSRDDRHQGCRGAGGAVRQLPLRGRAPAHDRAGAPGPQEAVAERSQPRDGAGVARGHEGEDAGAAGLQRPHPGQVRRGRHRQRRPQPPVSPR